MSKHTASAAGAAMPGAPPDIADAFSQTRLLIIAAGKIADGRDETHDYALRSVISAAEEKFTVALDWFEAEAWEERKATIVARHPASCELLHIVDAVNEVRYLIDAAWMARRELRGRGA
jgi:hypothetical protein